MDEAFLTRHIHISPYHPQSNRLIERFNGTLITILRKLAKEKLEAWVIVYPQHYLLIGKFHMLQLDFLRSLSFLVGSSIGSSEDLKVH